MATIYFQRLLVFIISICAIASTAYAESGRTDYDLDDDGLIEINSLADLNEIRNNLDGTTLYGESTGCPAEGCNGFELTTTLDFDTNADGVMDENDEYWNNGEGWEPIGDSNSPFTAIFDGNGHQIRNLYIDRPTTDFVGLFGNVEGETASLRNLGLTGKLMSVTADDYVGGLVGGIYNGSLSDNFATGIVVGGFYVGGLAGYVGVGSFSDSFATGHVTGYYYVGGLVGGIYNGSLSNSFATARVTGEYHAGGLVGYSNSYSIMNSHWATDTSGQASSVGASSSNNYFGATLAELQCPISSDDMECLVSNTLYATWDSTVWDFGTNQELPGLMIDGVVYRDGDGDGSLDGDDAFPNNRAGSVDNDNDGYLDSWTLGCDAECRSTSGLMLDQFPMTSAAWLDADLDGYPDSWALNCDASCQSNSGLTLDTFINDVDNDGVIDSQDNDDNNDGVIDADENSNGLIEVSTLEQLNVVRYNLSGVGRTLSEGGDIDSSGCPAVIFEGILQRHCAGYELTNTLDFDTNADGVMDQNDTYWNGGEGWEPIGDQRSAFTATFDGNGHQIRNLFIDRPSTNYVGLFGYVKGETASLRNLGLIGKLMSVAGNGFVGGLVGRADEARITRNYSTGVVTGDDNVGGLVGGLYSGALNHSFATGSVTGDEDIGGLIGNSYSSSFNNSYATGSVTANSYVGGLIGKFSSSSLNNSYATGYVNGNTGVGGLVGSDPFSSFTNNHWGTDVSGQASSAGASNSNNYFGVILAELQCPISSDDMECLVSNTLYATWDSTVWDFGTNQELPGLIIDGVVYRDGDGDGSLDDDDAFPNNRAGSVDNDNDGYLDSWTLGCDAECRSTSGLMLDQFPVTSAAWLDADLDGYPDSWAPNCDASCQSNSGLTLDMSLNDVDNDGVIDSQDNDDNNDGVIDADENSNGLIEVSTLEQLNAVRYNLSGVGRTLSEGGDIDSSGCPAVIFEGILQRHCAGYELTNTLDFDTNADGVMDENDTYWDDFEGWEPIGDDDLPFTATFDGNGHQIRNLYIDRPTMDYVGLFGYVQGETTSISNLGLTGKLMSVTGDEYIGGLAGYLSDASITQSYSTGVITGDGYVGGLVGGLYSGALNHSFATGSVTGDEDVGGLVGESSNTPLNNSYATGSVTANSYVGGLIGKFSSSSLNNSYATGYVNGNTGVGGLVGSDPFSSFTNNHWGTDVSGQASSAGASNSNNYFGVILAELQCPISSDDMECLVSNTLYATWDSTVWDFGTNQELPGLIIDGVVYRDGDGDGSLDDDDAFPNNRAGSVDNDNDGYLDSWTLGCDAECRSTSGLMLDQFPSTGAAWFDSDLDGYPDSWAPNCDASCQSNSGLTLDMSLNDVDNDGVIDSQDNDDNNDGVIDADENSNGLIEVSTLEQLNAVRYNLSGVGRTLSEGGDIDSSGCPAVIFEGALQRHCSGYELIATLDFDTNADGVMDENDTYWNDGEGWEPIGDAYSPFIAIFDGNGHQIRNIFIDRPRTNYVGLFGYIQGGAAVVRNIGLTGKLMNVTADDYVGGLVGRADEASITRNYSTGVVTGDDNVGGLVGGLYSGALNHSFATGSVTGDEDVGGLVGESSNTPLNNSYATGSVTANSYVGGLIGKFSSSSLNNSYATGYVNGNTRVGGLLGSATFSSSLTNNHWATDSSGQASSAGASNSNNYFGAILAELQCPISSDDMECLVSNTLYATWDSTVWDFGTNQELPGLMIDGVVYRDGDGDGSLDGDDAFPNNRAGSVDNDNDGYLDSWTLGCDAECRSTSGLMLDQFPMTSAAWFDSDLDGYPDSWAPNCDASCQSNSELTLDMSLNDVDNDGVIDSQDNDDNNDGVIDADADSNGLIDVSTLEQLNAVRYNLNGTGRTLTEAGEIDSSGCPAVILEGVLQRHCARYELTTTLDFDTNADGVMDENDTYWNEGYGWQPIGDQNSVFTSTFDGNGHQIRNLFIDRPSTNYVGLFGYIQGDAAIVRNIGLTGKLMNVAGNGFVGGLVGRADEASITRNYSTGVVTGDDNVGGLVGGLYSGALNHSFATGSVTGDEDVGGLVGESSNTPLNNSYATGSVTANSYVGGLIGKFSSSSLNNSYATGYVNGNTRVGGLLGSATFSSSLTNNHWATDSSGQASSAGASNSNNYFGAILAELQCPISSDDMECLVSNTLYASWDSTVWDFGTNQELPGLIIDGVVYRDSDGDGALDINQAPEVTLVLKQDGDVVPDVIVGAGDVNIEAVITDPDVSDVHTLTWTLSDSSFMGETDNTSASFSSDNIPDGEYTVAVVATDNRYSPLSDDASITFTVERNASSPSIENTPENSTSSGSSGGGGAFGVFWVLILLGLIRLRNRRGHVLA